MSKVHYHEYLKLDQVLNAQSPLSFETDTPAHDEMLFITIHQSYELWFKQILFELDNVLHIFSADKVDEADMAKVVHRLQRMVLILKSLVAQVDLLDTMTPMDFLEFRHLLYPASGFQSLQFRLLENKLGLKREDRLSYNDLPYTAPLMKGQDKVADASEAEMGMFDGLQAWLERTPFMNEDKFSFWKDYQNSVEKIYKDDLDEIGRNEHLNPEDKTRMETQIKTALESFRSIFDEKLFNEQKEQGIWKLSYPAVRAALLIELYRDQPVFQLPFRVLQAAKDLDAQLTQWRYRHALMAQRMLGRKVGTGGSSGATYLKKSTEKHRVFQDLYNLTSFFVPRSRLPKLPDTAAQALGFYFNAERDPHSMEAK